MTADGGSDTGAEPGVCSRLAKESVTIYRETEPQPAPGWRLLADSVDTATVSYQVPRAGWEAHDAAQRELQRAAAVIGQFSTSAAAPPET